MLHLSASVTSHHCLEYTLRSQDGRNLEGTRIDSLRLENVSPIDVREHRSDTETSNTVGARKDTIILSLMRRPSSNIG